ncbi:MAG TPA: hypothetical protein P5186_08505 [Candidatus Paceibacterota bacterium]|nr:hypothetical protein [Candidatus Paceibacterota bacterium]HSA00991.1 hypothetical protein [Candidatus Paceibacterota bacterium]
MVDSFIPLTLSSDAAAQNSQAVFRPATLTAPVNRPPQDAPPKIVSISKPHPHNPTATADPKVSVIKDGDRVTSIRIQCSCGQCVEIQCLY